MKLGKRCKHFWHGIAPKLTKQIREIHSDGVFGHRCRRAAVLKVGDYLLKYNGHSLVGITNTECYRILTSPTSDVQLEILRQKPNTATSQLLGNPPAPLITSERTISTDTLNGYRILPSPVIGDASMSITGTDLSAGPPSIILTTDTDSWKQTSIDKIVLSPTMWTPRDPSELFANHKMRWHSLPYLYNGQLPLPDELPVTLATTRLQETAVGQPASIGHFRSVLNSRQLSSSQSSTAGVNKVTMKKKPTGN